MLRRPCNVVVAESLCLVRGRSAVVCASYGCACTPQCGLFRHRETPLRPRARISVVSGNGASGGAMNETFPLVLSQLISRPHIAAGRDASAFRLRGAYPDEGCGCKPLVRRARYCTRYLSDHYNPSTQTLRRCSVTTIRVLLRLKQERSITLTTSCSRIRSQKRVLCCALRADGFRTTLNSCPLR